MIERRRLDEISERPRRLHSPAYDGARAFLQAEFDVSEHLVAMTPEGKRSEHGFRIKWVADWSGPDHVARKLGEFVRPRFRQQQARARLARLPCVPQRYLQDVRRQDFRIRVFQNDGSGLASEF